jgi:hypothetical protein
MLVGEQVELIGANLLGAELSRGAAEVAGEVDEVAQVGLLGAGAVVAEAEVIEEALA